MSTAEPASVGVVPYETTILVRDACLCLHAQRAARALARRFDLALRPAGINNGQFSLMMSLNRPEPPTMASVATLLAMDRTTLTANLKPLTRRGLVTVTVGQTDRRSRVLALTEAGLGVLHQAVPIWTALHGEIEADLPDPRRLRTELWTLSSPERVEASDKACAEGA